MPAWLLATAYLVVGVGAGLLLTPWLAIPAFALYVVAVVARGRDAAAVLATTFTASGVLLLAADVLAIEQPWRACLAVGVPAAVYAACDRGDDRMGS